MSCGDIDPADLNSMRMVSAALKIAMDLQ